MIDESDRQILENHSKNLKLRVKQLREEMKDSSTINQFLDNEFMGNNLLLVADTIDRILAEK